MKEFSLICAVSLNGVIGDTVTNTMPWYIPTDLKHFKAKTLNKTIVMGSRTYHSIGKPLKDRRNVVITRNLAGEWDALYRAGVDESYKSFADVLRTEREGFMVIGGAHIYGDALRAGPKHLYITIVHQEFKGDVRFPVSGDRFKDDIIHMQNGDRYVCRKRSGILEENDTKFQFTEFELLEPGSYA
jgi:dihydrofolate reductase